MAFNWLIKLGELFLPEKMNDARGRLLEPIEVLILAHGHISQLAEQILSHAESAPYPHMAERLRQIAFDKQTSARQLKEVIEKYGRQVQEPRRSPASGKNHWERMMRDLEDQKAFEGFLAVHQPHLSADSLELARITRQLMMDQAAHRDALAKLVALADPQATQT